LRCAFRNSCGWQICVYFDLRLRFELSNSQPQSVLRFCVFGGQGFFGLTKKAKNRLAGWMQMCILACGLYVALASVSQNRFVDQINFCLGFLVFGKETSFFLLVLLVPTASYYEFPWRPYQGRGRYPAHEKGRVCLPLRALTGIRPAC
jgi:hypothetical protein